MSSPFSIPRSLPDNKATEWMRGHHRMATSVSLRWSQPRQEKQHVCRARGTHGPFDFPPKPSASSCPCRAKTHPKALPPIRTGLSLLKCHQHQEGTPTRMSTQLIADGPSAHLLTYSVPRTRAFSTLPLSLSYLRDFLPKHVLKSLTYVSLKL